MAYIVSFNFSWPENGHSKVGTYKKRAYAREILISLAEFHYHGCWIENSITSLYMCLDHVDRLDCGVTYNLGFIREEREGL